MCRPRHVVIAINMVVFDGFVTYCFEEILD